MLAFTPTLVREKSTSYSTDPLFKLNAAFVATPPPPWISQPPSNKSGYPLFP